MSTEQKEATHLRDQLILYVVTDEREDGAALLPIVKAAIRGGATAIQLRRKSETGRSLVEQGIALRRLTQETGTLFFINDRIDVALIVEADGVHIGQDDISCRDARRLLGSRIIGVSAHTAQQALDAEREGADYVGVGAMYSTRSKPDTVHIGLSGLAEIRAAIKIPIVAIGGIEIANASAPIHHGADGIAVVSAVMGAVDPQSAAKSLRDKLRKTTQGNCKIRSD